MQSSSVTVSKAESSSVDRAPPVNNCPGSRIVHGREGSMKWSKAISGCVRPASQAKPDPLAAELYREHGQALHRFLLGLLRHGADADEALQQVFVKVIESHDDLRRETLKGWLYTVAYHEAMALRRRHHADEAALDRLRARPVWQSGAGSDDPAERLARAEAARSVRASSWRPARKPARRSWSGDSFAIKRVPSSHARSIAR